MMKVKEVLELLDDIKDNPSLSDPQNDEDYRDIGILVNLKAGLKDQDGACGLEENTWQMEALKRLKVHIEDFVMVMTDLYLDTHKDDKTEASKLLELWVTVRDLK